MRICMIGTGYVGLVAGTCFAETGNEVICMDVDARKIAGLQEGKIPIYEPGLEELIRRNAQERRLSFTTNLPRAVEVSEIVFVAVGTPSNGDGSSDLSYVMEAVRAIASVMKDHTIIVQKSTVPVGTADKIVQEISARTRCEFDVVSNPEFLKEGSAVEDFMKPDRVVIGANRMRSAEVIKELYAPFTRTGAPVLVMDTRSAEMSKYAANAMLASRISFMNEIANLCEKTGADVNRVRKVIGMDQRIGPSFLFPGLGYGGSCFPKDVKALVHLGREKGFQLKLIEAVDEVNELQKLSLIKKMLVFYSSEVAMQLERPRNVQASLEATTGAPAVWSEGREFPSEDVEEETNIACIRNNLNQAPFSILKSYQKHDNYHYVRGRRFAIWGLSFKPRTDDMREAPSRVIIENLLALGAKIQAYDPEAMEEARKIFGDKIRYARNNYEALEGADALVLVTEWNSFRNPDFSRMKKLLKYPVIFDGRNQYDSKELRKLGFIYFDVGGL